MSSNRHQEQTPRSHNFIRLTKNFKFRSAFVSLLGMIPLLLITPALYQANAATGINPQITYQAKVTDTSGDNISNGSYNFIFRLYNASTSGTLLWTEQHSSASSTQVSVISGLMSVALGSNESLSSEDFNSDTIWLEVGFDADSNGSFEETFSPRRQLTSAAYAFNADKLDGKSEAEFADLDENETVTGDYTFSGTSILATTTLSKLLTISGGGLTISSGTITLPDNSINKADLSSSGTLGFDWSDSEIADALTISGGTVDGTAIGATTASTGAFTSASTTGALTIGGSLTAATSTFNNLLTISSGGLTVSSGTITLPNESIDKGDLANSGTLAFDWGDSEVADDLTISSSGSVDSTALTDGGIIGFDWVDAEIADALTISGGTINNTPIGASSASTAVFTTATSTTLNVTGVTTLGSTTTLNGVTYTWPSADGSNSQVLTTNGSGVLSWAAGGGGGSGSVTTLKEADSQVGGADIVTIDFGAGFDLSESPDTEIQITLDYSENQVDISSSDITGTLADASLEATIDRTIFNASDYITALGGIHIGGASDPGTDNLIVDGLTTLTGNLDANGTTTLATTTIQALTISGLTNCNTIDSDANGVLSCGTDEGGGGGGGSIRIEENNSLVEATTTALDFLGADFIVTESGGEAEISLDYANSNILRSNQAETITGNYTFTGNIDSNGTSTFATTTFANTVAITSTGASSLDIGGGLNAGTGNVALIDSTGKIAGISSTYFVDLSGANLNSIPTSAISSGTFADARIAESNVTQHEAALTILESQITDSTVLARVGAAETITGGYTFTTATSTFTSNIDVTGITTLATTTTSGNLTISAGGLTVSAGTTTLPGGIWQENGFVGIGTTSPLASLQVSKAQTGLGTYDAGTVAIFENTANAYIHAISGTSGTAGLYLGDADFNMRGSITYNNSTETLDLRSAGSTRLSVDSSGEIGIGDGSPEAHLEVSADGSSGGNIFLLSSNDDNDGDLLTVTEAGLVGIGTTTPDSTLQVFGTLRAGTTTIDNPLYIQAGSSSAPGLAFDGDTNTGIYSQGADAVNIAIGGTNVLKIDSDEVSVVSSVAKLRASSGTAGAPGITFNIDTDTGIFASNSDYLGITTGGTERLRVDSSGNVGIGTSTPDSKLQVLGTFKAATSTVTGTLTVNSTDAASIDIAGGLNAGSGDVGIIDSSGKIPALSSTYFASLDGSDLTGLDAGDISAGTLGVARGGTGATTLTDGGILLGSGTGAVTAMSVLADGALVVGDGSTDPTTITAFSASNGLLLHEVGGIELDISSIGVGDVLAGASSGTIEIVDGGAASDGDVLTVQADGTVNFETPAGGGLFTDGGDLTYLTSTSDDLAIGSSASSSAPFFFDVGQTTLFATSTLTIDSNNSDIIFNPTSGNVSIGTTTADSRLSVQSTGTDPILSLFETGNTEMFTFTEGGLLGINDTSPQGVIDVTTSGSNGANILLNQDSPSGNVSSGIQFRENGSSKGQFLYTYSTYGTASVAPPSSFVYWFPSGGSANPGFVVAQDGTAGFRDPSPDGILELSAFGGANDLFLASSDDDNDGDLFIIKNDGSVGVGTTTPDSKLQVLGTFKAATSTVTGTLTVNSTDAASIDIAGGLNAGSGDVGIIDSSGKIPALSSTYFASLDGSDLTGLDAGDISAGTLGVARGGTGATTLTDGGILLGSGTGAVTAMSVLADGALVVGDGSTDPVALAAFTSSTGLLTHEAGGVELDISGIGTGDILAGVSAGTVEIVDGGSASDGDVLTIQADGTVEWEAAAGGSAAGTDGQLQYNNGGSAFGGTAQLFYDDSANHFGIGTTTPEELLTLNEASGDVVVSWNLGGEQQYFVGIDDSDSNKFKISTGGAFSSDEALTITSSGQIGFGTSTPSHNFTVANNDILLGTSSSATVLIGPDGTAKLTVGTVDPVYTINGTAYATYVSGMIGQKEETTDIVDIEEPYAGIYKHTIVVDDLEVASDLWLFEKASNLRNNLDKLVILMTPEENVRTWYDINEEHGLITFFATDPVSVSYRMTAPRFDFEKWTNFNYDGVSGFVISDEDEVSVPSQSDIDAFYAGLSFDEVLAGAAPEEQTIVSTMQAYMGGVLGSITDTIEVAGEWIFNRLKAKSIETDELKVNNGIQVIDELTGEVSCIRVRGGVFISSKGECSAWETEAEEVVENNEIIEEAQEVIEGGEQEAQEENATTTEDSIDESEETDQGSETATTTPDEVVDPVATTTPDVVEDEPAEEDEVDESPEPDLGPVATTTPEIIEETPQATTTDSVIES